MENNDIEKKELLKRWFGVKLKVHNEPELKQFKELEVWWCNFGENIGVEINGKSRYFTRPVLIFKKFNQYSFMGVPLTSQLHTGSWYVKFEFQEKENYANLAQAKTLSSKRLQRKIGSLTNGDFRKVKDAFAELYIK